MLSLNMIYSFWQPDCISRSLAAKSTPNTIQYVVLEAPTATRLERSENEGTGTDWHWPWYWTTTVYVSHTVTLQWKHTAHEHSLVQRKQPVLVGKTQKSVSFFKACRSATAVTLMWAVLVLTGLNSVRQSFKMKCNDYKLPLRNVWTQINSLLVYVHWYIGWHLTLKPVQSHYSVMYSPSFSLDKHILLYRH